jgi:hypothetical protein
VTRVKVMTDAREPEAPPAVSSKLRAAVRCAPLRQYQLAWSIGVNPATLSKLVNGIQRPRVGDPRIVALAKAVGVDPTEAFE